MSNQEPFNTQRGSMIKNQIMARGITHQGVIQAMQNIPRHRYVLQSYQHLAYDDFPVSLPYDQSISQPYIVALMTETLNPQPQQTILEIGTGSGYQTAVLSLLFKQVYTMEIIPALAWQAQRVNSALGYTNITYLIADGSLGWPGNLTFDAILVTAAAPIVPSALLEQLTNEGCMVIPVGARHQQMLELWTRENGKDHVESILPVVFVPLKGRDGWQ
jgi:protein-L-isoaspartate(D-aspartate) O-methyltransferase